MRPGHILVLTLLVSSLFACTQEQQEKTFTAADSFHALLDDHWAASVDEKIYFRNDSDAWRMDGKLSEHTAIARARRQQFNADMLARLETIDPQLLDSKDRISYQVFQYERETERDSAQQYDHIERPDTKSCL